TVTVAVLENNEAVVIHQAQSNSSALSVDWTGRHTPIHATGAGKVFLAHMPGNQLDSIMADPLERFTEHTVVEPARLREDLEDIRARGYAICFEELETGLNVIAAPVRFARGAITLAISVSGPAFRFPPDGAGDIGELTRGAADEISRCLGFWE
ncbi:MAG TPA: IclR family transcriptional regulator, partial [Rubrobacteraceae bacterium]|nr:IclR family transcriptional regulator [Rubrobacteraceae bacterium]